MIFNNDFTNIDWQAVCEYQQARDFELQTAYCQKWDPEQKKEIEPWHDPALIAMMEAQAESAEQELDMLLDF